MNRRPKFIVTSTAIVAFALAGAAGTGAAINVDDPAETAASDDETDDDGTEKNDMSITGPDLERAKEAALAHLGEGEVTETEVEDEDSYYEVEVRLADGRQVDVQLDEAFHIVSVDGD